MWAEELSPCPWTPLLFGGCPTFGLGEKVPVRWSLLGLIGCAGSSAGKLLPAILSLAGCVLWLAVRGLKKLFTELKALLLILPLFSEF